MTTVRKSRGGFDVFNYWVEVHCSVTKSPRQRSINLDTRAKKAFNSWAQRMMTSFGINADTLKSAILYAYLHNPLGLNPLVNYGSVESLGRSLPSYMKWRRGNEDTCREQGEELAIYLTIPTKVEGLESEESLQEMIEALRESLK